MSDPRECRVQTGLLIQALPYCTLQNIRLQPNPASSIIRAMTSVCLMSAPPTSPLRSTPRTGSSLPTRMYQTGEDRNTVVMRQPKFARALKVVETSRRFDPKHKLLVNIVEYTCTCSVCRINTVIIFVPGELLTICKENFGPY